MPANSDLTAACRALIDLGVPRVWSMLVSIFGELAFAPGDRIEGRLLTRLTDAMDIKRQAVRVALHRLRNDGWIVSVKSGRTANHALTPDALRQRNAASPLIYTRIEDMPNGWQIAVMPNGGAGLQPALAAAGFVQLGTRVYVANDGATAPTGVLASVGRAAPDWARAELVPPDLTAGFDRLLATLHVTRTRLSTVPANDLTPIETALLRCLIVHQWRRLVLRHPYLPPALLGRDWPGHQCRDVVCDLLDDLKRPALSALDAETRHTAT